MSTTRFHRHRQTVGRPPPVEGGRPGAGKERGGGGGWKGRGQKRRFEIFGGGTGGTGGGLALVGDVLHYDINIRKTKERSTAVQINK